MNERFVDFLGCSGVKFSVCVAVEFGGNWLKVVLGLMLMDE